MEITNTLRNKHIEFTDIIDKLTPEEFMFSYDNKWTAGQQLSHIYRSVSLLTKVLGSPKFFIAYTFGKANRPSKTYDDLINKYHIKLEEGGKASGRFLPTTTEINQKKQLITDLHKSVEKLIKRMSKFSDQDLETYVLPHPLLGKLTLREMLYFTIYHVQHHQRLMLQNLEKRKD